MLVFLVLLKASGSIGGHELQINAQQYVETVELIPTGKLPPVEVSQGLGGLCCLHPLI